MLDDPIFRIPHLLTRWDFNTFAKELVQISKRAHVERIHQFRIPSHRDIEFRIPSHRYIEFRIYHRLNHLTGADGDLFGSPEPSHLRSHVVIENITFAISPTHLLVGDQLANYLQTVSGRARDLGNTAFVAHNYPLAADYYAIAAQFDPFDMRPPLNLAAIHLRTGQQPAAFAAAHRAMLLGWTYGGTAALQDKARARAAAANPAAASRKQHPSWSQYAIPTDTPYVGYEAKTGSGQQPPAIAPYWVEIALAKAWQRLTRNAQFAAQHFAAAIALRPAEYRTYIQRAACWLYLGKYAQAAMDANQAVRLTAHLPAHSGIAFWLIGMCEFGRKRYADSRRAIRRAVELRQADSEIERCAQKLKGSDAEAWVFFEDMKRTVFEEGFRRT